MAEISRDSIIKLDHFLDKEILINFAGGRVVEGKLKGFDHLNNLVVDQAVEHLRQKNDKYSTSGKKRELGFMFVRGTSVSEIVK